MKTTKAKSPRFQTSRLACNWKGTILEESEISMRRNIQIKNSSSVPLICQNQLNFKRNCHVFSVLWKQITITITTTKTIQIRIDKILNYAIHCHVHCTNFDIFLLHQLSIHGMHSIIQTISSKCVPLGMQCTKRMMIINSTVLKS